MLPSTKKRLIWMLIVSAVVAIPGPYLLIWLLGLFGGSLFVIYLVYPLLCVVMGVLAGLRLRELWFFPIIPPILMTYMVYMQSGQRAFVALQVLGCYILLGAIPMGIAASVRFLLQSRK